MVLDESMGVDMSEMKREYEKLLEDEEVWVFPERKKGDVLFTMYVDGELNSGFVVSGSEAERILNEMVPGWEKETFTRWGIVKRRMRRWGTWFLSTIGRGRRN